jgi:hypothetical protein
VRTQGRELAGTPVATACVGGRFDYPLTAHLLLSVDVGVLPDSKDTFRPEASGPNPDPGAALSAGIGDLVLALRPVWQLAAGRIELYLSLGAGVSGRVDISGSLPVSDARGATGVRTVPDTNGWGVLAQASVGSVFWLNARYGVFVELLALARQTHAVIEDSARGDSLVQLNDANAFLVMGFGATLGGP